MKSQLFNRREGGLVDIELWAREYGHQIVRISYTVIHARVVYREAA